MSLKLIYHFQGSSKRNEEFTLPTYKVLYFFTNEGLLENEFLKEMSKSVPAADHFNLSFTNLDDLKSFAIRVCEERGDKQVRLISVQDLNIGIDGSKDRDSYLKIFEKYGELLVNESARKKGIFSKFFS